MDTETNIDEPVEVQDVTNVDNATPKKKRKWPLIVGIIVVVVIGLGVGGMIWHEQPSFCSAICHDPMDPYVDGYYDNGSTLLAATHARSNTTCLQCHEATIDDQIKEATSWVTGNFYTPLLKRDFANEEFCLKSCHVKAEIVDALVDYGGTDFNPHASHMGKDITCGDCHNVHRPSEMYCNKCHNVKLPEGWINPQK